jgi:hypothetical protein
MSDLLAGLGLQPDPGDAPAAVDTTPAPIPVPAPVPPTEPAPEPEIVIPEGAKNPDAVQRLIESERKNAREANARRRELEQQLQEQAEAALPLEQRIQAATKRAEEAEHKALRYAVGLSHSLPVELVDRLKGTTEEEIKADAQSLLTFLQHKPAPAPSADGGFQTPPVAKGDPQRAHNDLLVQMFHGRRSGA